MKKIILITTMVIGAHAAFSQGILNRLHFGVKGGTNYSNFTDANFDTEGLLGFHGGLIVNFELSKKWSLQEEFLYSTHGAKVKSGFSLADQDLKLSYASIPLMVKYHSNMGLYGEIGGQANILVDDAKNTGFSDFADKVDGGAVVGLGYQFRNGPVKGLGIGARYYQGLSKVGKFTASSINPDFKNSVAQFSLFYIF